MNPEQPKRKGGFFNEGVMAAVKAAQQLQRRFRPGKPYVPKPDRATRVPKAKRKAQNRRRNRAARQQRQRAVAATRRKNRRRKK